MIELSTEVAIIGSGFGGAVAVLKKRRLQFSYQVATTLNDEQVTLQLRQLPDREDWLVRSASAIDFLGWHLLTR